MPDYIEVCEKAVRAAGAVLMEKLGRVHAREKGRHDLVTEADLASQEVVRRIILDAFPDHAVIGEEERPPDDTRRSTGAAGGQGYRWIVDPLDGTTNYVHQVLHFCVSLALEHAGRLLVGGVYNPVTDEYFSAAAGQGACLNGKVIRTSPVGSLSEALAAVGFPPVVRPDSPDLQLFLQAIGRCQSIRRTGSVALNLCYVAAGRFDACWSFCTNVWDVAAGVLLIREAGGIVTSPSGGDFSLQDASFLGAANRRLHEELRALMAEAGLG